MMACAADGMHFPYSCLQITSSLGKWTTDDLRKAHYGHRKSVWTDQKIFKECNSSFLFEKSDYLSMTTHLSLDT